LPQFNDYSIKFTFYKANRTETVMVDNFDQAEIVDFLYFPKLNSLPVITNFPNTGILDVWLNKKTGQKIKTNGFLASYQLQTNQVSRLISFSEAQKRLENNQGAVVYSSGQIPYSDLYETLVSATVTQAYLAYYQPLELPTNLIPVWVFEGNALTKDNKASQIVVYLQATL
jgi:hypothetical protein